MIDLASYQQRLSIKRLGKISYMLNGRYDVLGHRRRPKSAAPESGMLAGHCKSHAQDRTGG